MHSQEELNYVDGDPDVAAADDYLRGYDESPEDYYRSQEQDYQNQDYQNQDYQNQVWIQCAIQVLETYTTGWSN